jgi:hypothetical protein
MRLHHFDTSEGTKMTNIDVGSLGGKSSQLTKAKLASSERQSKGWK